MGRTWEIFARICLLSGGNLSSRASHLGKVFIFAG